jgi:NDP-sugar pyrophosphorylase family protein
MIGDLFARDREALRAELDSLGHRPVGELTSIVLVGGKGKRLAESRKLIRGEDYPLLDASYHGMVGPKGMAVMEGELGGEMVRRPLTDWHLEIHAACPEVKGLTFALGTGGDIIRDYYLQEHGGTYKGRPIDFLVEAKPAGTLAPFVKLHSGPGLPATPVVYANGDNLVDVDLYKAYLVGCVAALRAGAVLDECVIDIISMVPWELSGECGTADVDLETGCLSGFREKCDKEKNPWVEIGGERFTTINSGIAIVVNPAALYGEYFAEHPEVVETSRRLEAGELDYAEHEAVVKYETAYQLFAGRGSMFGVYDPGSYWADLGTEEKIIAAEQAFPKTRIFS